MVLREQYLQKLIEYKESEFVKVITGVRRSGKSFLLNMFKEYLMNRGLDQQSIMYLNFEHPDTFGLLTVESLYSYIKENTTSSNRIYFLFDEVQEVENWQKLINGLRVSFDCDIYLTGSNANLLSGEMATYLSGRYIEVKIFPLSFVEYLIFKKSYHLRDKQNLLEEYLKYGGFPSIALLENDALKQDVLKGIYNSIILKDVATRGSINDPELLLRVSIYLMDNIGQQVSSNKIANYISSTGRKTKSETIDKYLQLLENSFIFYHAVRYDIRGKERLKTLGKYYVVDTGLRNNVLGRLNTNLGSQVENVVFLKLKQSGYEVFVGKYDNVEIDFVCFRNENAMYIQVAFELPNDDDRETHNLLLIRDHYERMIITMNYMDVGMQDGIQVIHLLDFLEREL